ncbi:hypothetical protein FC18_GL001914 [Lacticaseibacillus sharpeae JCM 1186 = DSM 20505]|uniref:Uncharacterized protein n=1 Tax=Lacticaseibacillus sharpeae JCM 1186 = DSM 20505 TaxID=1291052 RepID=A0A0R1ZIU2_9LACO|nr:hypothetical protein FC18_GL001914 [Lacticaseibacillus sharpeae JCM 1186 = DSM 20505]
MEKSDDEDTHAFMKGKYHKDGKNLIVLNVTWLGYYDIKHFKYEDSSSQLVDNKNDTYYKSYMKLDDSGNITSIVDYHDGYKTGGKLAKSGKPVDNGRIEDPVYLYKSEKYALKH